MATPSRREGSKEIRDGGRQAEETSSEGHEGLRIKLVCHTHTHTCMHAGILMCTTPTHTQSHTHIPTHTHKHKHPPTHTPCSSPAAFRLVLYCKTHTNILPPPPPPPPHTHTAIARRQTDETKALLGKETELVQYQHKDLHHTQESGRERKQVALAGRQRLNEVTKKYIKAE